MTENTKQSTGINICKNIDRKVDIPLVRKLTPLDHSGSVFKQAVTRELGFLDAVTAVVF
jgi:hypothetical protein